MKNDTFNGDNAKLVESIKALLALDESGSLVPHGVGGHARQLLSAAASRLSASIADTAGALPAWFDTFLQNVCEIPDRNSPEDEPEAMVATEQDLRNCALNAIEEHCAIDEPASDTEEAAALRAFDMAKLAGHSYDIESYCAGYIDAVPPAAPSDKQEAVNGIPATLRHDEGAIARCSYCGRYSLDPKTLSNRQPKCDCGEQHGWSGSFKKPGPDSKWSGAPTPERAQPTCFATLTECPTCKNVIGKCVAAPTPERADADTAGVKPDESLSLANTDWRNLYEMVYGHECSFKCFMATVDDLAATPASSVADAAGASDAEILYQTKVGLRHQAEVEDADAKKEYYALGLTDGKNSILNAPTKVENAGPWRAENVGAIHDSLMNIAAKHIQTNQLYDFTKEWQAAIEKESGND